MDLYRSQSRVYAGVSSAIIGHRDMYRIVKLVDACTWSMSNRGVGYDAVDERDVMIEVKQLVLLGGGREKGKLELSHSGRFIHRELPKNQGIVVVDVPGTRLGTRLLDEFQTLMGPVAFGVDLLKGEGFISYKVGFYRKRRMKEEGVVVENKARLVAQGIGKRKGKDNLMRRFVNFLAKGGSFGQCKEAKPMWLLLLQRQSKQLVDVSVPLDLFPVNTLTSKVFSFMVKKGKHFLRGKVIKAKEIKSEAQITKSRNKRTVIKHHFKAYLQKCLLEAKDSLRKASPRKVVHKDMYTKQGRKFAKGESSFKGTLKELFEGTDGANKKVLKDQTRSIMLKLKLESEEENTMALELIKFVKKILGELESEE
ncbi:hypothetical protein Tco_0548613 [Tanacetum coccineum]